MYHLCLQEEGEPAQIPQEEEKKKKNYAGNENHCPH